MACIYVLSKSYLRPVKADAKTRLELGLWQGADVQRVVRERMEERRRELELV